MFRFEQVYSYAPMRSHGISQYSFLVYLLGLRNRVTVTFWTSLLLANLSAYYAFVPSFCPSGYDFAIPSSRLHLTVQTLGVAFGLVGNYLPVDFHHRALTCPSYQIVSWSIFWPTHFDLQKPSWRFPKIWYNILNEDKPFSIESWRCEIWQVTEKRIPNWWRRSKPL